MSKIIVVAGATGNLGSSIVTKLRKMDVSVRAIVRAGSNQEKITKLTQLGAQVITIKHWNSESLRDVCKGADCVVSALAGLRDVIIDAQTELLNAAVAENVPRFIPSDYSLDFTGFQYGENRNLDFRREFHTILDKAPIKATTVFNGAFMDMLTGQMPMIMLKKKKIMYWGDKNRQWDFTTIDNTATYTANVAIDESTPRYLHIAGDRVSPVNVQKIMSELAGEPFKLFRPGGKALLSFMIKVVRKLAKGENELYPPWQGMQYMRNMIDERSDVKSYDNARYPDIKWTSVKDLMRAHLEG